MTMTVLIVDDHAPFRALARTVLAAGGFEVVGQAADGASALDAVRELRPDIVLLDVQLPDTDGFAVAAELALENDAPAVVLVSTRDSSDYLRRLRASPARGFLPKHDLSAEAVAALCASS
jgi:DNA-binding NarL/FixJ family response regulator